MSIYSDLFILIYCCVVAALLGAALGSFLNCAAWRICRNESFIKGRSRCPSCGHELGILDLFPIFSWLFLRGKCRYCGKKVSVRYFLTECFFALVTVLCLLADDVSVLFLRDLVFLSCLFCLTLTDLDSYLIPDGCHIVSVAVWLLWLPFSGLGWGDIGLRVLAGLVYGGGLLAVSLIMDKVLGKESLGGGDIKLFAVIGLYLGFAGTVFALILACVLGLIFAFFGKKNEEAQIPFGPSIAAAAAVMLLYGEPLVNWYLSLF